MINSGLRENNKDKAATYLNRIEQYAKNKSEQKKINELKSELNKK